MTEQLSLEINSKQLLHDASFDLGEYIVLQFYESLRDESHVWPTPELQKYAEEWRADMKRSEQELLYGDGTSQPLGVIHASGVIVEGRPNCPLCGRDLSETPSECRKCGIKREDWNIA